MKKVLLSENNFLQKVIRVLKNGGVVMHPTETCYGLAADIFNEKALDKVYKIKAMSQDKPVSILVDSLTMAQEYGLFSEKALQLAGQFWPGPLSIVVPRKRALPAFLNKNEGFVSMRYSSLKFCNEIVCGLGRPVTTTSANKSGEPEFYEAMDLSGVDLLVDGGRLQGDKPSTIVKVQGESIEIFRQGGVRIEM